MSKNKRTFGWYPDFPDFRDFSIGSFTDLNNERGQDRHAQKAPMSPSADILKFKLANNMKDGYKDVVDLREFCSPVENQGAIGSCTAHAAAALIEYYENRNYGSFEKCSRRFLYKVTRNYMKMTGDNGANPRSTMAAMVLFGVPPESYWEYIEPDFDIEPDAFLYSFAQNYKTVKFFRHDGGAKDGHGKPMGMKDQADVINGIKESLMNGIPAMCGFTVFSSIKQYDNDPANKGLIPYPSAFDSRLGGHAVSVFGYDDNKEIINKVQNNDGTRCKGAFLIKNSWGEDWGEMGYGWLPYKYVESRLAIDWWSIIKKEWVNTAAFGEIDVVKP